MLKIVNLVSQYLSHRMGSVTARRENHRKIGNLGFEEACFGRMSVFVLVWKQGFVWTIKKKHDFAPSCMWKLYTAKKGCVDVRLRRDELSWVVLLSPSLCWESHFPESPLLYDFKFKLTKVFLWDLAGVRKAALAPPPYTWPKTSMW